MIEHARGAQLIRLEKGDDYVELWIAPRGDAPPAAMKRSGRAGQPRAAARVDELAVGEVAIRYGEEVDRYRRDGWTSRPSLVPAEPIEPALEAALRIAPDDLASALVYADWLQVRDHCRGRLIAVQAARAACPDDAALAAEEARIMGDHAEVLFGALAEWTPRAFDTSDQGLALGWELGFIARARIDHVDHADQVLAKLFAHPSARFLRELVIGCHRSGDQDNQRVAETLIYTSPTPPLRRLQLADFDDTNYDGIDISRAPLGDLEGLGEIYPDLEDVVLKGRGDVELGALRLPRARRFALRTSTMTQRTLAAILSAPWPALEELELWFGDPRRGYGAEIDEPSSLAPVLAGTAFPALRVLRVMNAVFVDELTRLLPGSPLARRLEILDLSLGMLGDDGASVLAATRHAYPKLRALHVVESCISTPALERLVASGYELDLGPVSPARDPPRQKAYRYVSVSE